MYFNIFLKRPHKSKHKNKPKTKIKCHYYSIGTYPGIEFNLIYFKKIHAESNKYSNPQIIIIVYEYISALKCSVICSKKSLRRTKPKNQKQII